MGNYTLYLGKENIHVGCDLVIFLIRKGFVGGFGGREKIFCFRNANRKILNVYRIHLGGALPAPPQQDQFLLFSHTFLPKSVCVGGQRPPPPTGRRPPPPPNGKSWIRHWLCDHFGLLKQI